MLKFRKKPIVIEAFQMTRKRRWDNKDWPAWLDEAWNKRNGEVGSLFPAPMGLNREHGLLEINTHGGSRIVFWDDWIIRGVHGELYPCKPDIFEATYEPVETK